MEREKDLEERLAFLGITAEDRRELELLSPLLERHADSLVGAFYRHLLSFEETRKLLRDPAVKERLMTKQREYLISLGNPTLDEAYMDERRRIGQKHAELGLEPRWYLGAYVLYFSLLSPLIREASQDELEAERVRGAVAKILVFDAQIAMDAYIEGREEQLSFLNHELAEVSRKLESEYQSQVIELRETTHRAEAAEQLAAIATLVTGLAHEIGTPMGVIRGHAELLESSATDDRSRWRAGAIREQVDRISHIIHTLLNMARPREPVRTEVELDKLLENTLAFLQEKFRMREIKVRRLFKPVPTLWGDPDRMQQLCLNLFLNAVDAMPEGGRLSVKLRPKDADSILLRIGDNGHGIPPEELQKIFDPFFTTKEAGAGNGLGLVVARGIVLDHKGTIEVSSEVGKGTEFSITLPRWQGQSEAPSKPGT